ncbi:hypothetical protein [Nocardia nova]|uniref:hypothetical protein n=1 Tax=Nocardia nova TaxID=37330 RepID=UPI001ED9B84F|nr:hypothetical protein [Nocardia nova]
MRTLVRTVRLTLAAAAVVAGTIAAAGPANAVATPAEACGNNYHEIDHHDLPLATIYLLYNGTDNCVVTRKNEYVGTPTAVNASIEIAGQPTTRVSDSRTDYKYYAGPVRISAKGKCIQWEGEAQKPGKYADIVNYWKSKPSHCR